MYHLRLLRRTRGLLRAAWEASALGLQASGAHGCLDASEALEGLPVVVMLSGGQAPPPASLCPQSLYNCSPQPGAQASRVRLFRLVHSALPTLSSVSQRVARARERKRANRKAGVRQVREAGGWAAPLL